MRVRYIVHNEGFASHGQSLELKGSCDICGNPLERWYSDIIDEIAKYLPPSFERTCCKCTFKRAMHLPPVCPNCEAPFFLHNEGGGTWALCDCDEEYYDDVLNKLRKYREGLF